MANHKSAPRCTKCKGRVKHGSELCRKCYIETANARSQRGSMKTCLDCPLLIRAPRMRCRECYRKWIKLQNLSRTDPTEAELNALVASVMAEGRPSWWNKELSKSRKIDKPIEEGDWKKRRHRGVKLVRFNQHRNGSPII